LTNKKISDKKAIEDQLEHMRAFIEKKNAENKVLEKLLVKIQSNSSVKKNT